MRARNILIPLGLVFAQGAGVIMGWGEVSQAKGAVAESGMSSDDAGFKDAVERKVGEIRAADGLGSNIIQLTVLPGKELGKWIGMQSVETKSPDAAPSGP